MCAGSEDPDTPRVPGQSSVGPGQPDGVVGPFRCQSGALSKDSLDTCFLGKPFKFFFCFF